MTDPIQSVVRKWQRRALIPGRYGCWLSQTALAMSRAGGSLHSSNAISLEHYSPMRVSLCSGTRGHIVIGISIWRVGVVRSCLGCVGSIAIGDVASIKITYLYECGVN